MFHRSQLSYYFQPRRIHTLGVYATSSYLWSSKRLFRTTPLLKAPDGGDYYSALGVSPTASAEEIKAAYKRMALQYHPDRNKASNAEEKFKTISEAYAVIGNKDKRAQYDATRSFGGGFGGGGGSYSSQRPPYQSGNQTYAGAYPPRGSGFQTMTTAEADKLFREIFGSMNMEQMLRDMENRSKGSSSGGGGNPFGAFGGMPFGGGGQQQYRPNFQSQSEEVHTDEFGNRTVKKEFRDSQGNVYNVYTTSSTDPNASMNQSAEEVNEKYRDAAGRFRFGSNTSSGQGGGSWGNRYQTDGSTPFGRVFNSNMSVGHNSAARLYLLVFVTLVAMLAFGLLSFIVTNPIMWVLIGALWLLRRRF